MQNHTSDNLMALLLLGALAVLFFWRSILYWVGLALTVVLLVSMLLTRQH